jgi:hypothetical protein
MPETKKTIMIFGIEVAVSDVPIVKAEERFNQYVLEDGSVLKVKSTATAMLRVDGQYLPDGNPVYIVLTSPAVNVESSPLKRAVEEKQPVKVN